MSGDIRKKLDGEWTAARDTNFGHTLKEMTLKGFRGFSEVKLEFTYPIIALSGLNGSGKSTLAQLALCGFAAVAPKSGRYYVQDFILHNNLESPPHEKDAYVSYVYHPSGTSKLIKKTKWTGYGNQPKKASSYLGVSLYIPKVEKKDLSVYSAANLREIPNKVHAFIPDVMTTVKRILGTKAVGVNISEVESGKQKASKKKKSISRRLCFMDNGKVKYSENNMGFGESRLIYIIDYLESSPNQTLFVIEEPETALHEHAQKQFARYLLDVCQRKRHQIIITTHSSAILSELPPKALKYIDRSTDQAEIIDGMSSTHARSLLSEGEHKPLSILVEDELAQKLLHRIIFKKAPQLLHSLRICFVGDKKAVKKFGQLMKDRLGLKTLVVFDPDVNDGEIRTKSADKDNGKLLFKFPGNEPIEKMMVNMPETIDKLKEAYQITGDIPSIIRDKDHHHYLDTIAHESHIEDSGTFSTEAVNIHADTILSKFSTEVDFLIESIRTNL